ncbi:hypothetical protein EGW08_001369 [Elysia chlorotica]|uniref:Uncharacterized protein n=1 Tax=Elysia chlorotica TaxID=188477 RepID=A0A433UAQ9_ELYCH|nr:hypothetical protein EGW08_001369 [Elysia chlorotica]
MSGPVVKSAIVTGSSSGIGEVTALLFARQGYHVTLCGQDCGRLQEAVDKCRQAGAAGGHSNRFISVAGDMTDSGVRRKVLDDTMAAFGRLDVLVANHGIMKGGFLADLTEEDFDTTIDTNLKSFVFLIKDAVPHLEQTKGSIVCVSSILSTLTGSMLLPYFLSKAAIDHLVRCLALELGPKGIRINAVNPGAIKSRIIRFLGPGGDPDAAENLFGPCLPLAGQASTAQEQADAIFFLASDQARFIHGQCLAVDGGLSVKGNPFNWLPPPQDSS